MKRNTRLLTLLLAISVLPPGAAMAVQTDAPAVDLLGGKGLVEKSEYGVYIVLMAEDPVLTYDGDEAGFKATKPRKGKKLNPNSFRVAKYKDHLQAKHAASLEAAGIRPGAKIHSYTFALNGYAAMMSHEQALAVAAQKDVLAVKPDVMRFPQTDASPGFLGLTDAGGAWLKGFDGEGVVVGVIDSGIWPEHPSFADDGSFPEPPIELDDSRPNCEFGNTAHNPNDAPFTCNNKLIGARQMLDTYRTLIGADPDEYDSARDDNGHGSHTASTAAGNGGVFASIYGIPRGLVSGMAPRAHVVAYKGLGDLGGFASDLTAAIDQAVADGVDVINYSIGGGATPPGAEEIAFLFAAAADVFVATSAGNAGPGAATLSNPGTMPWMTTVGANTQSRFFQATVVLGDGTEYVGASITPGAAEAPLVDAEFAGGDLCLPGTLNPAEVTGKIVLCRRGGSARAAKSQAVHMAGGVGTIFYNNSDADNLASDSHWTPTVHIDQTPGLAIKAYIAAATSPTAEIVAEEYSEWPAAPSMAYFSSRGPNPVSPDIIKPDITAPGVQILAGNSPTPLESWAIQGELFQAIQGTSMSSPHVAGVFALIKQARPHWSAAMARSAMMTTAYQDVVDNDRVSPADPFDMGAGHMSPGGKWRKGSIIQPGLAYDAGLFEYAAFTCGMEWGVFTQGSCDFLDSIGIPSDPSDLNLPSIGIYELPGRQTVTRTVTSVAMEQGWRRYKAYVEAPPGFEVTVSPSELRLKRGQTATYEVTITNVGAPIGEWRFGSLTWKDRTGRYEVYSPIAVNASLFFCPEELEGYGTTSGLSFDVIFGYSGSYAAGGHGFEPAIVTDDTVVQDPDQSFDPNDGYSNQHQFTISGAAFLRFAMPEPREPDADLDLYLYDPLGNQVARSTAGGTDEQIDILLPMDGTWTLWVHGWSTPGGDSDYYLYTWEVSATPGGSLTIDSAPSAATLGATGIIDVSWFNLWDGTLADWHLGAVSHTGDVGLMCLTLLDVDLRFPTARPQPGVGPRN
jgi:subtilisin family serine protease